MDDGLEAKLRLAAYESALRDMLEAQHIRRTATSDEEQDRADAEIDDAWQRLYALIAESGLRR